MAGDLQIVEKPVFPRKMPFVHIPANTSFKRSCCSSLQIVYLNDFWLWSALCCLVIFFRVIDFMYYIMIKTCWSQTQGEKSLCSGTALQLFSLSQEGLSSPETKTNSKTKTSSIWWLLEYILKRSHHSFARSQGYSLALKPYSG